MSRRALAERAPPVRHSTVSTTSAQRFAARVRSRRLRTWGIAAGALALLAGVAWVLLWSGWLDTRTVRVSGAVRVDPAVVARFGEGEIGRPLVLARSGAVERRVRQLDLVTSARVVRSWPGTLRIVIRERRPVAAIAVAGGYRLVDRDGVPVELSAPAPGGLPVLSVDPVTLQSASSVRACLQIVAELPNPLRQRVRQIGASSPDGVWLVLVGGVRVQWGSAEQTPFKAEVLLTLLPRGAAEYDVSAPRTPAVRGRR